jgi:hypothetical protein
MDTLTATIDLRYPIKKQLDLLRQQYMHAHSLLKDGPDQKNYKKKYGRKWPKKRDIVRSLRALDAYAAGESFAGIGRTLNKAPRKAKDSIQQDQDSVQGRRYVEQAFSLQALFTRLPQQTLQT